MNPITYRTLDVTEIYPELFEHFERFQEVTHCWRKENGKWLLKEIAFTEQWDEADYRSLCEKLKKTIERQGVVFLPFQKEIYADFARWKTSCSDPNCNTLRFPNYMFLLRCADSVSENSFSLSLVTLQKETEQESSTFLLILLRNLRHFTMR